MPLDDDTISALLNPFEETALGNIKCFGEKACRHCHGYGMSPWCHTMTYTTYTFCISCNGTGVNQDMTVCRVVFPLNNDIKVFWIKELPLDIDEESIIKKCREMCTLDLGPCQIDWHEEVPYGVIPVKWQ